MKGFNLAKFKKIKETKDWATMIHEDGHTINIAKAPLSHLQRKQLEALPTHYADGGEVEPSREPASEKKQELEIEPIDQERQPQQSQANVLANVQSNVPVSGVQNVQPQQSVQANLQQSQPNGMQAQESQFKTPFEAQVPALEQRKSLNTAIGQEKAREANAEVQNYEDVLNQTNALPTQNDIIARNQKASNDLFTAYQNKQLDPNNYWENHSKIAAGIGVALSALGQAFGGTNGNQALEGIRNGIKQDIELQKHDQQKAMNLWKMNREVLGDDLSANIATENQLYTGLKYEISKTAAQSRAPQALINAQLANNLIDSEIQQNNFKFSLLNPTSDNPDPSTRVGIFVEKGEKNAVNHEIDQKKYIVRSAPGIFKAFDDAIDELTPSKEGTVSAYVTALNPFEDTPAQQQLKALLGPTFVDREGTVNRSALDAFAKLVTPHLNDKKERLATKRESLKQYLKTHQEGTAAANNGIFLDRFPVTDTRFIGEKGYPGGPKEVIKAQPGVEYEKRIINGKAYRVPVKKNE